MRTRDMTLRSAAMLLLLTFAAIVVHGYHSGIEDDAIYLPAIKRMLNPALFPVDSCFFESQTRGFLLLRAVAFSARVTHLPVEVIQLIWHVAAIFVLLAGAWSIACRCFSEFRDRATAVALVAVLLTMPVAGTSLYIADQHLHPRTLATGALLFCISATLRESFTRAAFWALLAMLMHPLMAVFGLTYVVLLALPLDRVRVFNLLSGLPLPFILKPNMAWKEALGSREYLFLSRWRWYEWLGVYGPMFLLSWFAHIGEQKLASPPLARLCRRLVLFSILMSAAALIVGIPTRLSWLAPLQPMRHLQLVYLLMMLVAGGLLAHFVLLNHVWRWLLLFAPLALGMAWAQHELFPTSPHVELPGGATHNRWVECFRWIQQNTPPDAYFAVDPNYTNSPGEENFGFRAIAERSKLADYSKDAAVVAVSPESAPQWRGQVTAGNNYRNFKRQDFLRLKSMFGVTWALVDGDDVPGLPCPYRRDHLVVCRIE